MLKLCLLGGLLKPVFISLQWHALDRAEQAKYYEMARKEKELHMQLYPGWSARDNYASHTKKKKRKRETTGEDEGKTRHLISFSSFQKKTLSVYLFHLFLLSHRLILTFIL